MRTRLPDTPVPPDELTPARIADALDTAADLVEEVGLYHRGWWDPTSPDSGAAGEWKPGGSCCAGGALFLALGVRGSPPLCPRQRAWVCSKTLSAVNAQLGHADPLELFARSDTAAREGAPERVIDTFRATAAQIHQQGATS